MTLRRLLVAATALAAFLFGFDATFGGDAGAVLRLKVGTIDPVATRGSAPEPDDGIFVVQFRRAIDPVALANARAAGARLLGYLPDRAYVVHLPPGAKAAVRALPEVRWLGAVDPSWKIAADLGTRPFEDASRREGGRLFATADIFDGEDPAQAAKDAGATGAEVIQIVRFGGYARLKLRATLDELRQVARIPAVSWIEEVGEITPRNNTTRWVVQSNVTGQTPIWDRGLHGEGQVVGHIDGRIDMNSCWFRDASNNTPGPDHRKVVAYRSNSGLGADSHGTHTAGTSAGDQFPLNGTLDFNGSAYAAKISHSNVNDVTGSGTQPSNLYAYLQAAHGDGARQHTNSWGDDGTTAYTTWCVDIDRFAYDHEDSLVMFAVTNTSTLKTPENAKNCLAVGASSNGANAGSFCSGGRGPTNDGRRKPEIFAPGCSIVSAGSGAACSTRSSTGTSMASPAVAGTAALVRQYFEEGWYPAGTASAADARTPTAALVKATLLNAAVDMTGIANYPSDQEGWGRVLLESALHFAGDARRLSVLDDLRNASGLTTGATATYPLTVEGSTETLRVTLAWTEPPASLLANPAAVNNLDLEVVSPSGTTYLGNVIDAVAGASVAGGSADAKNNVEMAIIPAPEAGEWTLRVRGAAVNQGSQGFALVATGEVKTTGAGILRYAGHVVDDAAPFGNADGIADPGETVVLPVSVRNASATDAATGISGVLSTDQPALVRVTRETATWPDLAAGQTAASNAPHHRLTISPGAACGTLIRTGVDTLSAAGPSPAPFVLGIGKTRQDLAASGLPVPLPKGSSTPTTSTVQVSGSFTIRAVDAFVDIAHQNAGELVVQLRSPQGTTVTLHNRSRAGTADVTATYDTDRPVDGPGSLADFNGQQAQGTWTLSVLDDVKGSTPPGALRGFALKLEATTPISCSPLACGSPAPGTVEGLAISRSGASDARLDWTAAAGAAGYRVWRSETADFTAERLAGTAPGTTFTDAGAPVDPPVLYYRVRAVNECEWEGP